MHPVGETLPMDQRLFRIECVTSLLRAGIPLSKLDSIRGVLEQGAWALSSYKNLLELIPFIRDFEIEKLKNEIKGRHISCFFDGTTDIAEVFAVVLRYCDDNLLCHQRLIRLGLYSASFNQDQLAQTLVTILLKLFDIEARFLFSCIYDSAATNLAAIELVKRFYPQSLGLQCLSPLSIMLETNLTFRISLNL
eukprot:Pompholyxophrys_punicea_v1_NODE_386_length_2080_cov_2.678519.p1 type:complete len:193 gc:universal NODE_386_length_2080_cov_2.678519:1569-991(-)